VENDGVKVVAEGEEEGENDAGKFSVGAHAWTGPGKFRRQSSQNEWVWAAALGGETRPPDDAQLMHQRVLLHLHVTTCTCAGQTTLLTSQ